MLSGYKGESVDCVIRVVFVLIVQFILLLGYLFVYKDSYGLIAFLGWLFFIPIILYDKISAVFTRITRKLSSFFTRITRKVSSFFTRISTFIIRRPRPLPKTVTVYFFMGLMFIIIAILFVIFDSKNRDVIDFVLFLLALGVAYFAIAFQFKGSYEADLKLDEIIQRLGSIETNQNRINEEDQERHPNQ